MTSYHTHMARWRKRREKVFRLYREGYSKSEISRLMGVSRQRIGQILDPK